MYRGRHKLIWLFDSTIDGRHRHRTSQELCVARWKPLPQNDHRAAKVGMDNVLMTNAGNKLIIDELDRCFEVTQDPNFLSYVNRGELHSQQLENAMGGVLPSVTQAYAILRNAKLHKGSRDKVVTWTDGTFEHEDVTEAILRLDHIEIQTGTNFNKAIPVFYNVMNSSWHDARTWIPQMKETSDITPGVLYTETEEVRDYLWKAMFSRSCCTFDKLIDSQISMK